MSKVIKTEQHELILPVLPLRDVVVFPDMVVPLFVGRPKSAAALEHASQVDNPKIHSKIFLCAQQHPETENPGVKDLFNVGTIATVIQFLKLPDGTLKVLVEGIARGRVVKFIDTGEKGFFSAVVEEVMPEPDVQQFVPMVSGILGLFKDYIKLSGKIPSEVLISLKEIKDPGRVADNVAAHLHLSLAQKQKVLEALTVEDRLNLLSQLLPVEIGKLQIDERLQGRVRKQMEDDQRRNYLHYQMQAIQKELGAEDNDVNKLKEKIEASGMTEEAMEKATAELAKLKLMSPMSAEAAVSRGYLETLVGLPWNKVTPLKQELVEAEKVLNDDHYGLPKVKERILEFLAVQQRVQKLKGPILCLAGPPGVGKTSLGESIARATGREFIRVSLGGLRDEAEIRGHRRTYIGALPGKILQKIAKVGVRNPLFLLDEIDKMSMDFRGDPASALLEVLDPEQNATFNDHYLEVDFDLSDVMFVATANSLNNMPSALVDRMEVINLSGYTEDEKINIALKYLIPKQKKLNGLAENEIDIPEDVVRDIIRYYTREAGVRNLEREISKICRKVVRQVLGKAKVTRVLVTSKNCEQYLGVRRFRYGIADKVNQIGEVTGLAWTEVGGELLKIEGALYNGKGKSIFTGSLGEVMQESITAAMTVARRREKSLGLNKDFFEKHDFHIHVPEGATPKDGPSAGIGMCTVLVSILTNSPVRADYAMTGEINLLGEVLPIGGLKEKLLAAHRGGIKHVIIPKENEKDLKEIPANVTRDLDIIPVESIDEVLKLVLEKPGKKPAQKIKARVFRGSKSKKLSKPGKKKG